MDTAAFWTRVATGDGCWEWTGPLTQSGYGDLRVDRKRTQAHRVAWQLVHGPIPAGRFVLHSCDNRKCVRPDHLRVGTQTENMRDMDDRGRRYSPFRGQVQAGEQNRNARLSLADVREIKRRCSAGERQRDVAADYGITQSNVSQIMRGHSWRDA